MAALAGRRVLEPLSPEWWATRLWIQLQRRQEMVAFYEDYYTGKHPLPWLSPRAAEEFREILRMSRSNYMGLVVDAQVERMNVEGFRLSNPLEANARAKKDAKRRELVRAHVEQKRALQFDAATQRHESASADPMAPPPPGPAPLEPLPLDEPDDEAMLGEEGDADTWRLWQYNNMDGEFDKALLEAAISGVSYLLVAPNEDDETQPLMYVEHPSQAIVEYEPGTNRRKVAAGLKVYDDDWTATVHAVLYLPDGIYKFKQSRAKTAQPNIPISDLEKMVTLGQLVRPIWEIRNVTGESWPAPNPLGEVPLTEIQNNPRLLTGGRSELEDVTDIQDRVNKTLADRLITQDYGAFPQKWVSGWPNEDNNGTANPEIQTGRNRIVTTEVVETKFGQWSAAPLDPYSAAKQQDVKDIASRTRTPAQYLLGEMSNVNGQTLKASESGLVAKCRQRMKSVDDGVERHMRLARKLAGLPNPKGQVIQTLWRNPEHRTEGELVDALTKMNTLGVPQEVLWERWGATPEDIRRWKAMQDDAARRAAESDPTAILAARYRDLAGVAAIPMQSDAGDPSLPDNQPPGGVEPSGQSKSATNNRGSGIETGKTGAGSTGKNGRPKGPGNGTPTA